MNNSAIASEAEELFLRDVRQYVRKLFIVVNKTDLLAVSEREEVLRYIQAGIERTPLRLERLDLSLCLYPF